jgi:GNAT superfamily N-acetyltransferase
VNAPLPGLVRAAEAAEIAAFEDAYRAAPAALVAATRMGSMRFGGVLLAHAAALDVLMYNRLVGLGVAEPARLEIVDEAEARFRALGAKRFMVPVAPGAEPAGLEDQLAARGFYRHNHWIRLARDLVASGSLPAPRTDLRIATLGPEHAEAFGQLEAEAFGHPPEVAAWNAAMVGRPGWTFFGAFDGATLAAVAGLHVQGPAAWFGYAATHAAFRGRGAQSALIAARLRDARTAGCRWCVVETAADTPEKPNPSTHNLRRLGFRDAYERPNWVKVLEAAAG